MPNPYHAILKTARKKFPLASIKWTSETGGGSVSKKIGWGENHGVSGGTYCQYMQVSYQPLECFGRLNKSSYGGFLKWGDPEIVHFKRMFLDKASFFGNPQFMETPMEMAWKTKKQN